MRLEIVDIAWLKQHEEIKPDRLDEVAQEIKKAEFFYEPILVDENTGVILDGHHRYNASLRLGFKRIPAVMIDYLNDNNISVDVWPGLRYRAHHKTRRSRHGCKWQSISSKDIQAHDKPGD